MNKFDKQSAIELKKYYKNLFKDLFNAALYHENAIKQFFNIYNAYSSKSIFAKYAEGELFEEGEDNKYREETFELLRYVYRVKESNHISENCKDIYTRNYAIYNSKLKSLNTIINPLRRLLSFKFVKESAQNTYELLERLKNGEEMESALALINKLKGIENADKKVISDDFTSNCAEYLTVFEDLTKGKNESSLLPMVRRFKEQYEEITGWAPDIKTYESKKINQVKQAIDNYKASEIVQLLRQIPIDEINRSKQGLRLKPLKNAGYTSIADVISAGEWALSSIDGISLDAALTITRIAHDFARKASHEIKLKLTADTKTKLTTQIVRSLYAYKLLQDFESRYRELIDNSGAKVKSYIVELESLKNGAKWCFFDANTKSNYKNHAEFVRENLSKGFASQLHILNHDFTNIKYEQFSSEQAWDDFSNNSIEYFNIVEKICPGVLGNDDSLYGLPEFLAQQIQDQCYFPDGLLCTLRKYQEWGVKYILHQERVLLGDEMGLGKTVQAIATMVSLRNTGKKHFIVVCPASVVTNWCREITKHSKLRAIKVHGIGKKDALNAWIKIGGVAVTTYETTAIFSEIKDLDVGLIVVDEAHYIKNKEAARTKNTRALCLLSKRLLFMTGTALENNVEEMIGLIEILQPQIANKLSSIAFLSTAPQFRKEIAPVYYRRKREDVLTELPELIENEEWCDLNPLEEQEYERALLSRNLMEIRRVSWNIENLNNSSKANRLLELVEEAKSDNRKIIVFSFFLDTLYKVYRLLGHSVCVNPITGKLTPQRRQEIIDEFTKAEPGTVLCSQILSGGTGLNIQAASVVIICEPQLKPSIENQGISRAYRMGQSRNVLVYRLLCADTIDERIMQILEEKQQQFDAFADKSIAAQEFLEIDSKSMNNIIQEEIDRITNKHKGEPADSKFNQMVAETRATTTDTDYDKEIAMTYDELVQHLIGKYGPVKGDYFLTESCKSRNTKISRGKEGLFVHHIDENKEYLLSSEKHAAELPFDYQKASRLVYCNILEHLLLHSKIAAQPSNMEENKNVLLGIGGIIVFIVKQINDCYSDRTFIQEYMNAVKNRIINNYEDYIKILKTVCDAIDNNPIFSYFFDKKDLCLNSDGELLDKVWGEIKD